MTIKGLFRRPGDPVTVINEGDKMKIKIGTSGYSFPDWKGPVYPAEIKKEDMLRFYQDKLGFHTVELNYTYYTLPAQKSIAGIMKKTGPDFDFSVKAYREMTHGVIDKERGDIIDNKEVFEKFKFSLKPLRDENKLSCVLAQFPYSFHCTRPAKRYLEIFRDLMGGIPVVAEFRNAGWYNEETIDLLKRLNIGYCVVDEPQLPGLMPFCPAVSSSIGYFRFHGRNKNWFGGSVSERYNYFYNKNELEQFVPPIKEVVGKTKETLVFFNNCHAGSAARNAVQLARMLDAEFQGIVL